MIKINFYPDWDDPKLIKSAKKYQEIWNKEGEKIANVFEKIAGIKFRENTINSIIFEIRSVNNKSHPFILHTESNDKNRRVFITHELSHRLLYNRTVLVTKKFKNLEEKSLEVHKCINLFLYDAWIELWGTEFANYAVELESNSHFEIYKRAWEWALQLTKEERVEKFKSLSKKRSD